MVTNKRTFDLSAGLSNIREIQSSIVCSTRWTTETDKVCVFFQILHTRDGLAGQSQLGDKIFCAHGGAGFYGNAPWHQG